MSAQFLLNRRTFLQRTAALALATSFSAPLRAASIQEKAQAAVELAHDEIWRRFVDKHDVLLDFTGLDGSFSLPTPEECRAGKPNAPGWWAPNETARCLTASTWMERSTGHSPRASKRTKPKHAGLPKGCCGSPIAAR